jgi:2-dehydro-3-deoxygluconokinase
MTRVASIGECMIELSEHADGRITRSFGGDSLNTAVYLARLGVPVDYVTALGDDAWSGEMLAAWAAEGVGTASVIRLKGRLPGLYFIQTDPGGERRFSYWRGQSPARDLFALAETSSLCAGLARYGHVYLTGVSLSLYGTSGRAVLLEALAAARKGGTRVVFDTNFRPRGWPDRDEAKAAFAAALGLADIVFASVEDLVLLCGPAWQPMLDPHRGRAEVVLKLERPACRIDHEGLSLEIAAEIVPAPLDTTAAGDSFGAAYLAARLQGQAPPDAARAGHALARVVVQHRGAILPREAWPRDDLRAAGLTGKGV